MTPETKAYIEEMKELEASAISLKFDLVQGDQVHRLAPGSGLVVNTCTAWLVSDEARSGFKLRQLIPLYNRSKEDIKRLIQIIEAQEVEQEASDDCFMKLVKQRDEKAAVIEKVMEALKFYATFEEKEPNMARQTLKEVEG